MRTQCFLDVFFWGGILDRCFARIICILGASDVIEESPAIFGMPPWAACNMCQSHLCNGRTLGRTRNVNEGILYFNMNLVLKGVFATT